MTKTKKESQKQTINYKVITIVLACLCAVLFGAMVGELINAELKNAQLSSFSKWMAYGFAEPNCQYITPDDGKNYGCVLYEYDAYATTPYLKYYYAEINPETNEVIGDSWHNLTVFFDQATRADSYERRVEYDSNSYPIDYLMAK